MSLFKKAPKTGTDEDRTLQWPLDTKTRVRISACLRNGVDYNNFGLTAILYEQEQKFGTEPMRGVNLCLQDAMKLIQSLQKEIKLLNKETK